MIGKGNRAKEPELFDYDPLSERQVAPTRVIEAALAAWAHHHQGYDTATPWDANHQLVLMDRLGEALAEYAEREPRP